MSYTTEIVVNVGVPDVGINPGGLGISAVSGLLPAPKHL